MTRRVRNQRPVKGGRVPAYSGLIPDLEYIIEREMRRYNVSRSFVIATSLALFFGIEEQENYKGKSPRGRNAA
jgi:hypothetical protein